MAKGKLEVPEDGMAYIAVGYQTHLDAIEKLLGVTNMELVRMPPEMGGEVEGFPVYFLGIRDGSVRSDG